LIFFSSFIVLDDALSIKRLDEDSWEVGVHISDVTYFIKPQSALDKEARARAVRVDLIHTHVPMLPEILTEQVTNLIPNESR
jgi:exoribonuclease R